MKRYMVFAFVVLGSAATAIAAIAPASTGFDRAGRNVTVIEMNQAFPMVGPLIVEDCATEDCAAAKG